MRTVILCAIAASLMVLTLRGQGQPTPSPTSTLAMPVAIKKAEELRFKYSTFTFARIKYAASSERIGWYADYPDAEVHLTEYVQKATGLKSTTKVIELTDPTLKDYPFAFLTRGGKMQLQDEEVNSLRNYLLGGGFLMTDDSWGEADWDSLAAEFQKLFPDRKVVDLPLDHEIFRSFYLIKEKPQVPNIAFAMRNRSTGVTWVKPDAKEPYYRAIVGENGRLMVIFCHNTDLGDGWEEMGTDQYYTQEFSLKRALPMGINIVVYALTH